MATLQSHKSVLGIKRIFVFESRERFFFLVDIFVQKYVVFFFFYAYDVQYFAFVATSLCG